MVAVSMPMLIAWLAAFVILGGHEWISMEGEAIRVVSSNARVGRQQRVLEGRGLACGEGKPLYKY